MRFVVEDVYGESAPETVLQLPALTVREERLMKLLSGSIDIPVRLAPSVAAVLDRETQEAQRRASRETARLAAGTPETPYDELAFVEAADDRPEILEILTTVVAMYADQLEPQESLPEPTDEDARDRIGWANSRAYAIPATRQRLVPELFPNGQLGDLGMSQPAVLEGDVAAARALAVAVAARLGRQGDDVQKEFTAAGRGGVAPTAARLLLNRNPDFLALQRADQRAALVRVAARRLETAFASRDERGVAERELTEVVENRREDIIGRTAEDGSVTFGGAGAVDALNLWAAEELRKLHALPRQFLESHEAEAVFPPGRAESVHELASRIRTVVGELTGTPRTLWDDEIPEPVPGQDVPPTDYTLRLSLDEALALRALTQDGPDGPLTPEVAAAARQALQNATAPYVRWAIPYGYGRRNENEADRVAPRFKPLENGVSKALAEIEGVEIIDRILPPEQAEQLKAAEPPLKDTEYAPAALAFANAVDAAKGTEFPNKTLRRMGGQGRAGIAIEAAHRLVSSTAIAKHERPFAVRMIADSIDQHFDALPAELESWSQGGQTVMGDLRVNDPAAYGQQVAQQALGMVTHYEENPGSAQRESAAADRTAAQEAGARFGSADPAMTQPKAHAPGTTPEANRADGSGESKTRGLGR
ncbi:hypothetical protein EV646_10688 [Kribbella antiqua]|uniref:Uncharacterized protein n=2 Tax=Kribbella antiqua TaxID=2512217 RepID=A0A4R2IRR1_9ACTN|nr:hypothetical protein EV646_10688 [Kribbella antiqua]